jgi:hypothetical protein
MDRLLVAALAAAGLLALAPPAFATNPVASFEYAPDHPAPGQLVSFRSTSTPGIDHTEPLLLEWDLDNDGQFDDAKGASVQRAFDAGQYAVRLRASHRAGHEDIAQRTLVVAGEPTPTATATPTPTATPASAANQPPVAAFDPGCNGTLCTGLFAREGKPHTFDASPSHDPDGTIARYEWDLDNTGGYEVDTGATPRVTHTFQAGGAIIDLRKRTVRVRVTDDKGATAEQALTLSLLEPACEQVVDRGRIHATGTCLRPHKDGWVSKLPIELNGIAIAPKPNRTVTLEPDGIRSNGARVTAPVKGAEAELADGAFSWGLADGIHVTGIAPSGKLNGLAITAITAQLNPGGTSKLALRVALPAQFGGATSDEPITVTPGAATASAREPLRFGVRNAAIGPVGLDHLVVSFDGEDLWEIAAGVKLPPPIPYTVSGDAGIRDGAFEHAGAEIQFGTPGIGPLGPVFLQRIAFRIEIKPKRSKCVPKTGVETIDQRRLLHDITGRWFDLPNLRIDHGTPTFALCGEVALTGGPTVLGAAAIRLDAGLGLATYDDRPAVLRASGKVKLVEIPLAEAELELHTNGYTRMGARFDWGIDDVATLKGRLQFEMMAPKFNALAYVDACLEFVDWCAGARAIVSSKGVAVCLKIDVLVDDWEPGFGYAWGDVLPTLYFAGCDVGEYKEHISSGIDQHVTAVPASLRSAETAIDLPAGLPGATIVARGQGGTPKLTLIGPKGERITSPDGVEPVQQAPFFVMKDPRVGLTQFAISKPTGGRWRVIVEPGSVPVVSLASANGLAKPEMDARVVRGRTLEYRVKPVPGQTVTFIERGASAGGRIGAANGARGTLALRPAPGARERRTIVALVTQDGNPRGEYEVARYTAPAARKPARPRGLRVARRHGGLKITWRAAKPADVQQVTVRLADGRRLVRRTRATSLFVPGVRRSVRAHVSVRGILDSGIAGPAPRGGGAPPPPPPPPTTTSLTSSGPNRPCPTTPGS